MPDRSKKTRGQILLTAPDNLREDAKRSYAEIFGIKYSPLSRKIVTFNLVALCLMMAGILYLNQFDDSLITIRETALESDARFLSETIVATVSPVATNEGLSEGTIDVFEAMVGNATGYVQLFDKDGDLRTWSGRNREDGLIAEDLDDNRRQLGLLEQVFTRLGRLFGAEDTVRMTPFEMASFTRANIDSALAGNLRRSRQADAQGQIVLAVALPLIEQGAVVGALVVSTHPGEIDALVRRERGQILRIFFLTMVITIILSIALANTIAHPLQQLAEAAERGSADDARTVNPGRIEIPDLTGRPDEIGYLAGALQSMTTALYDRIEANENFAADVAHEIKNPLTSLRSAVDTMKYAKDDAGREKLMAVITHDVNRLDRLVTDISNASRLDSELVRDERLPFNINNLVANIVDYNQEGADKRGGTIVADLSPRDLMVQGLEGRLAQVIVNLVTNAISFLPDGGTVTVRTRDLGDGTMRVIVEDTGPGIPDDNLKDVFKRFYSERPGQEFGNNSGLGLAISKQIMDAHGGNIWAENIRAAAASLDTPPDGARFVMELPL